MSAVSCVMFMMLAIALGPQRALAQADQRAQPLSSNRPPVFPELLRHGVSGGNVRVRFVVDTSGRVEQASWRVLESANEIILRAVRDGMMRWRFTPARRDGRTVSDTVEQLVTYHSSSEPALVFSEMVPSASLPDGPGRWLLTLGPSLRTEPALPDSATQVAIMLSALDEKMQSWVSKDSTIPPRIACISYSVNGTYMEPSMAIQARLAIPKMVVVSARRCPRGYGSPARVVRVNGLSEPDPPGEDPFVFRVVAARPWTHDEVLVDVEMSHATGGEQYHCLATREEMAKFGWRSKCVDGRAWVH